MLSPLDPEAIESGEKRMNRRNFFVLSATALAGSVTASAAMTSSASEVDRGVNRRYGLWPAERFEGVNDRCTREAADLVAPGPRSVEGRRTKPLAR